jgi:hypothetical protein
VPPVRAIWCSRMASFVMALRISFSSSLAISWGEGPSAQPTAPQKQPPAPQWSSPPMSSQQSAGVL